MRLRNHDMKGLMTLPNIPDNLYLYVWIRSFEKLDSDRRRNVLEDRGIFYIDKKEIKLYGGQNGTSLDLLIDAIIAVGHRLNNLELFSVTSIYLKLG